jgi:protein-tyrosine phosphatase
MAGSAHSFYLRATEGPGFVRARFGTARGLARLVLSRLRPWRRYSAVNWSRVERLVFVCTGNICRSPYAAALARRAGIPAISVALRGRSGAPAFPSAAAAAHDSGIDLSAHRSTPIDDVRLGPGDLLVAMEPWQAQALAGRAGAQVTLLGLWSTPRRPHLHDPYGLCDDYFRTCFRLIDSAVAAIAARMKA